MSDFSRPINDMSIARSIQNSILHTSIGLFTGTLIEALIPPHEEGADLNTLLLETAIQVGCVGAAVALLGPAMSADDPTSGLLFSTADRKSVV